MASPHLEYFDALVRHETDLWAIVERRLTEAGAASLGRLKTLRVIEDAGSCRVQDAADALGISVGAASRLTDRLERDGLVARVPNPDDRRGSLIRVTDRGRGELAQSEPLVQRALEEALGPVEHEALRSVARALNQFNAIAVG